LVIISHASNVDGTVLPVSEIANYSKQMGALVLVDGAQSSGWIDCDIQNMGIDFFATSLHKGLLGPFGLGVLIINNDFIQLDNLKDGGTGIDSLNLLPENILPAGLETGTLNIPSIAGVIPALEYLSMNEIIHKKNYIKKIFPDLIKTLSSFSNIKIFGPTSEEFVPIFCVCHKHINILDFSNYLEKEHNILARAGLHCSPLQHNAIGTLPDGAIRFSLGQNTTYKDIEKLVNVLKFL
jgi:selenocysteine lyase/cysteine desulfurase